MLHFEFVWVGHLVGPIMGCYALLEGDFCFFIYVYFSSIFQHRIDFFCKTGPKKAILRTNAHAATRKLARKSRFCPQNGCFCIVFVVCAISFYICVGSGMFFVPQASRLHLAMPWKNNTQKRECRQDACGTRKKHSVQNPAWITGARITFRLRYHPARGTLLPKNKIPNRKIFHASTTHYRPVHSGR